MVGPIRIGIEADAARAKREIGSVQSVAGRVGGGFRRMAVPAVAALGAIGAAAGAAVRDVARIEKINAQTAAVLRSTGNAAGTTVKDVERLAGGLEALTATEAESIQEGANVLLTFTNIRNGVGKTNKIFDKAVSVTTDMSRALGTDLKTQSIQVGKALNDPIKGITALQRVGVSFTADQRKQIEGFVASGKTMKAQKVILGELNRQFGGSGAAFAKTAAGQAELLKHEFGALSEEIVVGALPALNRLTGIGRNALAWAGQNQGTVKAIAITLAGLAGVVLAVNAAMTIATTVTTIWAGATKVAAGAQRLLNFAMAANPIGLVVVAIAALVAGLVIAYKRSETFRNIVNGAFNGIRKVVTRVVGAVVGFVKNNWRKLIFLIGGPIGVAIGLVVKHWTRIRAVTTAAFGAVRRVIATVIAAVVGIVRGRVTAIRDTFSRAWEGVRTLTGNAFSRIRAAVASAIARVITTVVGLRSKITSGLGNLGTLLYQAGKDVINGLISGIKNMATAAVNAAKDVVGGAISGAKNLLGIRSPSRVFRTIGYNTIRGLVLGLRGGRSSVAKVISNVVDDIPKKARRKFRDLFNDLRNLAARQDKLNKRFETQRKTLERLRTAAKDYAAAARDAVVDYGSLTSLGQGNGFADIGQLIAQRRARLAEATQFTNLIAQLRRAGLNKADLDNLIQAGVEGGLGTARTIAAGGKNAIKQLNSLATSMLDVGKRLGATGSQAMYRAGIDSAKGLIDGLRSRQKALDQIARRLATTLANSVRKALKIKSPSRVFAQLGQATAEGLRVGVRGVPIAREGVRLADALRTGFGAPALDSYITPAGAGAGSEVIKIEMRLTPAQTSAFARGEAQTADVTVYRGRGGRVVGIRR